MLQTLPLLTTLPTILCLELMPYLLRGVLFNVFCNWHHPDGGVQDRVQRTCNERHTRLYGMTLWTRVY